jgi:hypothetical protein
MINDLFIIYQDVTYWILTYRKYLTNRTKLMLHFKSFYFIYYQWKQHSLTSQSISK